MKSLFRTLFPRTPPTCHIPADHASFVYTGRLQTGKPGTMGFIWQASSAAITFSGSYLALGFANLQGQAYFDVELDGNRHLVKAQNGWLNIPLHHGDHQLRLFKRTEANAGRVDFRGITIAATAKVHRPATAACPKYIFYGDSITVGACNEDGDEDQWLDRRSHNSARSYAALTAAAMDADYHNIAVSGIGIVMGFEPYTAGQVWNRMAYHPTAPLAPLQDWPAEQVFVHYGENDAAFTRNNNLRFPASFTTEYRTLIRRLRAAYPAARIVLLRGGMAGGASDARLQQAWNDAVIQLEREDQNITHYVFAHRAPHHPRVVDHQHMAEELVAWLRQNPSQIA